MTAGGRCGSHIGFNRPYPPAVDAGEGNPWSGKSSTLMIFVSCEDNGAAACRAATIPFEDVRRRGGKIPWFRPRSIASVRLAAITPLSVPNRPSIIMFSISCASRANVSSPGVDPNTFRPSELDELLAGDLMLNMSVLSTVCTGIGASAAVRE